MTPGYTGSGPNGRGKAVTSASGSPPPNNSVALGIMFARKKTEVQTFGTFCPHWSRNAKRITQGCHKDPAKSVMRNGFFWMFLGWPQCPNGKLQWQAIPLLETGKFKNVGGIEEIKTSQSKFLVCF